MKHRWSPKARATHRQPGLGKPPGSRSCYPEREPPRCRAKERRRDQQLALTGHQLTPSPTPRGSRTAQPHNGTFGTTDSWIRERTDPLADVLFSSHLPFSQVGGGARSRQLQKLPRCPESQAESPFHTEHAERALGAWHGAPDSASAMPHHLSLLRFLSASNIADYSHAGTVEERKKLKDRKLFSRSRNFVWCPA